MKPVAALLAVFAIFGAAQAQPAAPHAMRATAPGLADYTDETLFGEVWKRPGLSPRDRSLITVSALVAAGRTQQLTGHTGRALDNGVLPVEIAGIITQLAFYAGWPLAVSAISVVDEVFRRRGIDRASLRQGWDRQLLPVPASDAARAALVDQSVGTAAPALADYTNRLLFDDLWRRADLSPRDRSIVTIAGLIATGDHEQLTFHMKRGMENGITQDELGEALTHLAFYVGWPKAMSAVPILAKVVAEKAAASNAPITVIRSGVSTAHETGQHFIGTVRIDTRFSGSGARVSFEPGARTAWHKHPLGQLLIIITGHGLVQSEGGPVEEIGPGDTVWIPAGVRHWHGATPTEAMTHIAVTESQDGKTVEWMEQVSEADYRRSFTP
jgi:4-carboxymuconolactone decarboxylase